MAAGDPPPWLKSLPLAPEYHPTESEFSDPIAFISRIEEEASRYGICKIIPPFPAPSKKFVLHNLNRSLSPGGKLLFTTRQQELGSPGKARFPAQKQVWQSGELYTAEKFEAKSKALGRGKPRDPILIEGLFWKTLEEKKPIYVEYANDVPGSGFCSDDDGDAWEGSDGWRLSISPWNLKKIAKSPGSLTRFMPDEVPGVTTPMVYVGMLFSWFAWHVEDHELHSLNFLHMGSPKTWYAVPGIWAEEFEEVVRVHGYGGQVDRLASFSLLGEKTTLISPEVIIQNGIPCCRLVQNPGEFVVTFPKAYHVGFSHGFNCGEAANFATPTWLHVAKEAAVRRATMNHLPMLSHQEMLYTLAMSYITRVPGASSEDPHRKEGENIVKKAFLDDLSDELRLVNTVITNNSGSSVAFWHPSSLPSTAVNVNQDEVTDINPGEELPSGVDVDSGTLTCSACGILGYPFMALLQLANKPRATSAAELGLEWEVLDRSLRPRIFCMEHAVHVTKLLQHENRATRALVICHSDYLKIKRRLENESLEVTHNEVPLRRAEVAELNLIDIAIGEEVEGEAVVEDWTSRMGFHQCNGHHMLTSTSGPCTLAWRGRKARTLLSTRKRRRYPAKHSDRSLNVEEEEAATSYDISPAKERPVAKLKQYQRRLKKMEPDVGQSSFARGPCEGLRPRNRPTQVAAPAVTKRLKCPWKGCGMSFKWAWERKEHVRVHTSV